MVKVIRSDVHLLQEHEEALLICEKIVKISGLNCNLYQDNIRYRTFILDGHMLLDRDLQQRHDLREILPPNKFIPRFKIARYLPFIFSSFTANKTFLKTDSIMHSVCSLDESRG